MNCPAGPPGLQAAVSNRYEKDIWVVGALVSALELGF